MKDAINAMCETQESARSNYNDVQNLNHVRGPPSKYEKLIQKLESDIRGHIKLEHEMKIHMDYLENKIELFQAQASKWESTEAKLKRQAETAQDKLLMIKENKDHEIKDLSRKLSESTARLKESMQKSTELERQMNQIELDQRYAKARTMNNSMEFRSIDHSGIQSSKSMQKN